MVTASDQDIYPDAINGENLSTMFYYRSVLKCES